MSTVILQMISLPVYEIEAEVALQGETGVVVGGTIEAVQGAAVAAQVEGHRAVSHASDMAAVTAWRRHRCTTRPS